MSVVTPGAHLYPSADRRCFLCNQDFVEAHPVVMWVGSGVPIYLHGRRCASSFVLRFARDALEVEHSLKGDVQPAAPEL